MIEWGFVPLHIVAHEIAPNVARHHQEISEDDGSEVPNIDWDTYLQASDAGMCQVLTVRDNGVLVGYGVFVISPNLRYKHSLEATSNGIFLEKEYRGSLGMEIFKKADEYLKSIGVNEISYILSGDRVARLLQRNGYKSTYRIWSMKYQENLNGQ